MSNLLQNIRSVWRQLGLNQKISLLLASMTVVAAMAGMLFWASRPDMQLLYGRLDPKDAGDILAALDAQRRADHQRSRGARRSLREDRSALRAAKLLMRSAARGAEKQTSGNRRYGVPCDRCLPSDRCRGLANHG